MERVERNEKSREDDDHLSSDSRLVASPSALKCVSCYYRENRCRVPSLSRARVSGETRDV